MEPSYKVKKHKLGTKQWDQSVYIYMIYCDWSAFDTIESLL